MYVRKIQSKYSQIHADMHFKIQIYQSICVCMCLYVIGIQANMHLIQPLSEHRYIQIRTDTYRYMYRMYHI